MLGTYASFALVLVVSSLVGQAALAACGRRLAASLAPAIGLAAVCAIAWGAVQLPGEGTAVAITLGVFASAAIVFLAPRLDGHAAGLASALPVVALALAAASLPFLVEDRFGILGTGLNPDMSQHLFAADRLADGGSERLIAEGYPLGPHAVVVGIAALGPSTVEAFDGLMLAVAVAASLAPLALLRDLAPGRRYAGALAVGFAYLVAAHFVQGAFKETLQALFVLAFAIGLHEIAHRRPKRTERWPARAVPLGVLAVGSAYVYSFPGLAWLLGALGVWAALELAVAMREGGVARARRLLRDAAPAALVAALLVAAALGPEIGRMTRFAEFETFDPAGAGLGNLFDRLSPFEALGVWPSGDFRVEPGGGFAPAVLFYLGAALAVVALALGLRAWLRRGERAVPAALAAAALLWLYALVAGTPYQEAKALALVAPLTMLISIRGLLAESPTVGEARRILARRELSLIFPGRARRARERLAIGALALAFLAAAGGSAALALVNGPVGPSDYSPALRELAPRLGEGSTLVLADEELLGEHGRDYLVWELRGNRVCVERRRESEPLRTADVERLGGEGYANVLLVSDAGGAHRLLRPREVPSGPGPCPFVSDGARADPGADD